MYKIRSYGAHADTVHKDGVLACANIGQYDDDDDLLHFHVYFMYEGTLYFSHVVRDVLSMEDEYTAFMNGNVKCALDKYSCDYEPCSTETYLRDIIYARRKSGLSYVELRNEYCALYHYRKSGIIKVMGNSHTLLYYRDKKVLYKAAEIQFEGYPDMEDSSTIMNFMLAGGNAECLQKCTELFASYTLRMDIRY